MTTFHVPDMSCGHCKAAIESAVARVDPQATVNVDLNARDVSIVSQADTATLVAAMKAAGYDATVTAGDGGQDA